MEDDPKLQHRNSKQLSRRRTSLRSVAKERVLRRSAQRSLLRIQRLSVTAASLRLCCRVPEIKRLVRDPQFGEMSGPHAAGDELKDERHKEGGEADPKLDQ